MKERGNFVPTKPSNLKSEKEVSNEKSEGEMVKARKG